jgi:hypothetical protein
MNIGMKAQKKSKGMKKQTRRRETLKRDRWEEKREGSGILF